LESQESEADRDSGLIPGSEALFLLEVRSIWSAFADRSSRATAHRAGQLPEAFVVD